MIASVLDTALGPEVKDSNPSNGGNLSVTVVTMANSSITSYPVYNTTLSYNNTVTPSSGGGESQFTEREQQKIALATALSFLSGLIMVRCLVLSSGLYFIFFFKRVTLTF